MEKIKGESVDIYGNPIHRGKLAEIVISQLITRVVHMCPTDASKPQFEGEVHGAAIKWPVVFGRYPLAYCPWCGLPLPTSLKRKEA